jgi:hypothetical protein
MKRKLRLLICGDRGWDDQEMISDVLKSIGVDRIECVIEGECRGADILSRNAARELEIEVLRFPADWKSHGDAAGPIRNRQMLVEGKPTHVIAFHNDIANSSGTADMISQARKLGFPAFIVSENIPRVPVDFLRRYRRGFFQGT